MSFDLEWAAHMESIAANAGTPAPAPARTAAVAEPPPVPAFGSEAHGRADGVQVGREREHPPDPGHDHDALPAQAAQLRLGQLKPPRGLANEQTFKGHGCTPFVAPSNVTRRTVHHTASGRRGGCAAAPGQRQKTGRPLPPFAGRVPGRVG